MPLVLWEWACRNMILSGIWLGALSNEEELSGWEIPGER